MKKITMFIFLCLFVLCFASCGHEHLYGEWTTTKAASCLENGVESRYCSCGEIQNREIYAAGHTWENSTCETPKTCAACGTTEGSALGHSYSEKIKRQATCIEDGEKTFTCSVCRKSYTESFSLNTYTSSELFELVKNSIAEIITYDKNGKEHALGSGFVYRSDGQIITNYHVIENGYSATVKLGGKSYSVTKVLAYDKDIDIAVLKINASNLSTVKICNKTVPTGAPVYAIGSSKGFTATISDGIVTHASREIDGVIYVQHNAAISSGNSGGPLINAYGEIIGINTLSVKDSQNLNFAIFASEFDYLGFGTPLTMSELYKKENPLQKIKDYAKSHGTYLSSEKAYRVLIGTSYSSDYTSKYARYIYYYPGDDTITLDLLINDACWVYIEIDELDGIYSWRYFDENDYEMSGTLYATTYNENSLLSYNSNNIYSSSTRSTIRELASLMVDMLCSKITTDLKGINVSAKDLGFLYY